VAAQSWPRQQLQVIVVDNASRRDVSQVTRPFGFVQLVSESEPGSYAARNKGLSVADGELLAFTDADCLPRADWLVEGQLAIAKAQAERGPRVAVGGRLQLFAREPNNPTWTETYELSVGFDQQSYVEKHRYAATANCFITREALQATGPFDARLRSGGDREWGQRAASRGVTWSYAERAVVAHPARSDLRELLQKRQRQVGGAWTAVSARHPRWVANSLMFARVTRPPLSRLRKAWQAGASPEDGINRLERVTRVACVAGALSVAGCIELCRLNLGATPQR
jgi:glycosyltransferase involved in cell wall biosynthesis